MAFGRYDWYTTFEGRRLHYVRPAEFSDDQHDEMREDWAVLSPVRLACGRRAKGVIIAGMFSRMGMMRCRGCCRAMKMPPGKGSPKNDDECRKLLGLARDSYEDME